MADENRPDWTTEMDFEILGVLLSDLILSPAIIAENIGRSREAVSRRLNTLEAGGLVSKAGRGKYRLTSAGSEILENEYYLKEFEREEQIENELGMSLREYQDAVEAEYRKLVKESDGTDSFDELLESAFKQVDKADNS